MGGPGESGHVRKSGDLESRVAAEEARALAELELRVQQRTAELEDERAILAHLVRELPIGVVLLGRDGRATLMNTIASDLLERAGLEIDTLLAEDLRAIEAPGTERPAEERPIARALLGGESTAPQLLWLEIEGTLVPIEIAAAPLLARRRITGAVVTLQDVSDRERRERAEREFVTNAAHELQTPLTAILSASEVLEAGAKEIPADRDRFLGHIRRECERLARLARALLVLAQAQMGTQQPPLEEVELGTLLDEIALAVQPAPGVDITVRADKGLTLPASRELLEEALLNLAANAARYTPEGTIQLVARGVEDAVCLEVVDTGVGLPRDIEALFGRFARGAPRDREGFGLGLSIAREAVKALGGELTLRTRPEGGTVATIVLPRPKAPTH